MPTGRLTLWIISEFLRDHQAHRSTVSRIDHVIALLHQSTSPEQRDLSAFIERRGGAAAFIADEQLFASIYRDRRDATTQTVRSPRRQSTLDYQAFRTHILDDPDIAIANNMETFERKFKIQQVDLAEEIRGFIHHHGDLVVKAVTAGPHDRIVHPVSADEVPSATSSLTSASKDLRNIWQEMVSRNTVAERMHCRRPTDHSTEMARECQSETFRPCSPRLLCREARQAPGT